MSYKIAGLQKVTLVDYPGLVASVVFSQGCNFRCGYCYNPQTVIPEQYGPLLDNLEIMGYLERRLGKIDGVVLSGGEPTIQGSDMIIFLRALKEMGFKVKLDTNGTFPDVIAIAIEWGLDYIAMDVKAPRSKYPLVSGVNGSIENIERSIALTLASGLPHEFRTTVCAAQLNREDLIEIGHMVKGADLLALQKFQDMGGALIDPSLGGAGSLSDSEFESVVAELGTICKKVVVR